MLLAMVLLCLTMITTHLTSGLYARYIVRGSGEDDARVAKFYVTQDATKFSENLTISIEPGTLEKQIQVINDSEVAINYTLTIRNATQNIPLLFQVGDEATELAETTVSYSMAVGETNQYTMKVIFPQENADQYIKMVDTIEIVLIAEQID